MLKWSYTALLWLAVVEYSIILKPPFMVRCYNVIEVIEVFPQMWRQYSIAALCIC